MNLSTTSLTLTTLYDNYAATAAVQTRHGFACLVEADGRKILFDTGGDGAVLMANVKRIGVNLRDLRAVILSHAHGDHTGGLGAVLAVQSGIEVILPTSFADSFKKQIQAAGARIREVSGPERISPSVATTGEMGEQIVEQSLLVNTSNGLVVVTGCAHPGIVEIVMRAKELTGARIHLVLGGFHLGGVRESELRRILAELGRLGVEKVAPCHCSGDAFRRLANELYGADYVANGVGMVIRAGAEDEAAAPKKLNPADAARIFDYVAKKKGISRAEAEKLCHLYVCRGGCDWYKNRRDKETFDPTKLSDSDTQELERMIRETGFDLETAKRLIHLNICHR